MVKEKRNVVGAQQTLLHHIPNAVEFQVEGRFQLNAAGNEQGQHVDHEWNVSLVDAAIQQTLHITVQKE